MKVWLAVVAAGVCACAATEGPLLYLRDAADAPGPAPEADAGDLPDASPDAGSTAQPGLDPDATWQYQITGSVDTSLEVELLVVDLFNVQASEIAQLHATGKVVMAYVSAGSVEPWRVDADSFPEAAVGEPLADYPQESWLDIRDEGVRGLMAARLDRARSKGFDGVFPTSLDAFLHETGFDLSADEQRDYNLWLAAEAHARGMSAGWSNARTTTDAYAQAYDWVILFECVERGDCAAGAAPFLQQGKAVFDIETAGDAASVCPAAAAAGVNALIKSSGFGAARVGCR